MLKQAFGRGKELQEEIVPLSNIFSNRLNDFIDNSDDENVISCRQRRNATSLRLPATGRDKVIDHSRMEEGAAGRNKVASHSRMEPGMDGANGDLLNIRFSTEE